MRRGTRLRRNGVNPTQQSPPYGQTPGSTSSRSWTTTWRSAKLLCSTNAIESLNARYRRAVTAKGHFPNEQSALKTLYLVTHSLDPKGTGQEKWTVRWKPALNAFAVTFTDRMPPAETL